MPVTGENFIGFCTLRECLLWRLIGFIQDLMELCKDTVTYVVLQACTLQVFSWSELEYSSATRRFGVL